ncbi:MAG: hypothetical protein LBC19_02740, partial [Tannerella sp.]|nr:hypothetical protein [Tannerella sp.]
MTEFWQFELPRNLWNWTAQVVTGAAHLSGNRIAGAEALTELTGNFLTHPYVMKQVGDWAFSRG